MTKPGFDYRSLSVDERLELVGDIQHGSPAFTMTYRLVASAVGSIVTQFVT
jgi:hypothetical protein